ncbi:MULTISPECIES: GH1 family beta-glucosidase [unclassified Arcicella]|uniref:GH1 family beta-glucosidase n=1 Tax=unclassified Arcicella TaxID=2644986 RepID=UPI00285A151F|nr:MULTISPECIES: GH1 family beta-glucosidase [unclassified Arcicella]MDR6561429.1 beta-glucosidase [Arcicella sp. BE51]MDR6811313.1 beta-glucosidase [Arcicella sp. BE140]MDR6822663.1 beta-glucosidase [Arcicella sp. BE139]
MQDNQYISPSTIVVSQENVFSKDAFGKDFAWGVAMASFQNEGAWDKDGKGESIWDKFSHKKNKIKDHQNAKVACDFYHRFEEDILLAKSLNFNTFRFSMAWTRILPHGIGKVNQAGLEFYHQVIDCCLENGLEPYVTLYHWDLPQSLEDKGGWTNRDIIDWFSDYCEVVTREFASKVKYWMVLNEPAGFTGLGYMTGYHAPGRLGMRNFLPAVHHAAMCQAEGGRIIRKNVPEAVIGTTFSCSFIEPYTNTASDIKAAKRIDALLNRLFLEPTLGLGYPVHELPFLQNMVKKYVHAGDMEKLQFDFDFIGVQNYFKLVVKGAFWIPYLKALEVKPKARNVESVTDMGWEISPDGMYNILKQFAEYKNIKQIIVTENGAAFKDELSDGNIDDNDRVAFYQSYLQHILKAKQDGVKVNGYLAWTLTDNFEWTEGYKPRFGLVHIDFKTQQRTVKKSGKWFREFLG